MKTKRILSIVAALVASTIMSGAFAAEKAKSAGKTVKNDKPSEWAELFGSASLPVVWQSVSAASEKIDAALAAKKLDGVADWAETIHVGSHALEDQIKIEDAERAKRLRGAFEQAAKIADDVLKAARHDAVDDAVEAQRRLKAALALAKTRMPKDILDAPKQELRFAKAPSKVHDKKGEQVKK
jgi:hypothetical protein